MTIPIVDQLDSMVGGLASSIGKPEDQIRLMLCLYIGYPLGGILNLFVRGTTARHLFSFITGFLLQTFMFREQFWHTLLMTFITYAMMIVLPRHKQARFVFIFVMGYLSFQHIYRMYQNFGGYDMDITTFTMVLTAKLSALAYCYKDGAEKDEKLLPEQIDKKVVNLPTVLELLSYVYFPCASIVGPFYEFADYKMYIEKSGRYSKIPSSWKEAMKKFLTAKICLVIHIAISTYCYPAFCGTEEYATHSFLWKVAYYYLAMTGQRFVYYTTWCLTDGQMIGSGLGYAGKDEKTGKDKFDKIYSIRVLDVEFGLSPQLMMVQWNHQIHLWLKYYIYNRTLVPGQKPGLMNNMAVFITSAFWHGFYPCYYMIFFFSAILSELAKDIYRSRILFRWIPSPINSILASFLSMLMMNFIGVSFMLLTFEKGIRFSASINHFVYITILGMFVLFRFGGITKRAAKLEKKIQEKAATKASGGPENIKKEK